MANSQSNIGAHTQPAPTQRHFRALQEALDNGSLQPTANVRRRMPLAETSSVSWRDMARIAGGRIRSLGRIFHRKH